MVRSVIFFHVEDCNTLSAISLTTKNIKQFNSQAAGTKEDNLLLPHPKQVPSLDKHNDKCFGDHTVPRDLWPVLSGQRLETVVEGKIEKKQYNPKSSL